MDIFKVSSKSKPLSIAGAIAHIIREQGFAEIQAIGAGAVNQSVKSIAIARGIVAPSGVDLICTPAFIDIEIESNSKTAIKFIIEPKNPR